MNMKAPPRATMLTLVAFLIACIGVTLWLWLSFGGTIPFQPQGYRIWAAFPDASDLQTGADVRISGVDVGTVVATRLDPHTHLADAELQITTSFAPRPVNTRAILRHKTLLSEDYIELTPGSAAASKLPDGGSLAPGQVAPFVPLDDLLRTFDPATRAELTTWLADGGEAVKNDAPAFSAALADLYPFAQDWGQLLKALDQEDSALTSLISDGGSAITGLTERPGQLRALMLDSDAAFRATARRDGQLAAFFRALPGFLNQTKLTTKRVARFSRDTLPFVNQFQPVATELTPFIRNLRVVAPPLRSLLAGIRPLAQSTRAGVPALESALRGIEPLLARTKPFLGGLIPVINYLNSYRREVAGAVANTAAATQATLPSLNGTGRWHYIRSSLTINPEALAPYPYRFPSSRANPYPQPGAATDVAKGPAEFGPYLCVNRAFPTLSRSIDPVLRQIIAGGYFTTDPSGPPCRDTRPLGPVVGGGPGYFPQLKAVP
jgi:virulence factor Mce-like protein